MEEMIYEPLNEFLRKFQASHASATTNYFEELVKKSAVDIEANRKTVKEYHECNEGSAKLKKSLNRFRFLRVVMCITVICIPLVIWKTTPKIKTLRTDIEKSQKRAKDLMDEAIRQMAPLNALFTDRDALNLIEKTVPNIKFERFFTAKQEKNMSVNFDFGGIDNPEQSTVDVLYGEYKENPFLFENKLVHEMGTATYQGSIEIHWTETEIGADGKRHTVHKSETLYARVTKPKPYYRNQVVLNYCSQGGPDLTFSRSASHLEAKNEKSIKRYVKAGAKKLKRRTDAALKNNQSFMSMSNAEFEIIFNALNRSNEVQYRTLFTPLAQTNMVDLLLSKDGYGDDFDFVKVKRTNKIISQHSQGRVINLTPNDYISYSYDIIRSNFVSKNAKFFRDVYFDFAPIWSIPIYQERPVHSLMPIPDEAKLFAQEECEALANAVDLSFVVHPDTKTPAILKTSFVSALDGAEENCITAYSYDIEGRIDYVSVHGGDGHYHDVPVHWDEYIPLEENNSFYIKRLDGINGSAIASRNGLGIYRK